MTALSFFRAMQRAMDDQAVDVWNMVEYSRSAGYRLRLGEVTLTELNFYRLRRYWTKGVYIRTNEPHEPTTGADWEWIIGHDDQWVQIRVQAKVINSSGSFSQLSHGPSGALRQQMDRLIDPPPADVGCRWIPLYVFYTATPPAAPQPQGVGPLDARTGCSAHLARHVRQIYGPHQNNRATLAAKHHLPNSIRWSSIFDGLTARLAAGETLPAIIKTLANQSFPTTGRNIHEFWDSSVTAGTCHNGLPQYISTIVEHRNDDFDDARLATLEVEAPANQEQTSSANAHTERSDADEVAAGVRPALYSRHRDDENAFAHVSSRRMVQDSSRGEFSSLPNFVSVIDIDKLPHLAE